MTRALIVFLFVFNSAWATDYVGRLAADEQQKGGDPSLSSEDAGGSTTDILPGDASAPGVSESALGASADRSSLPDDPAPAPSSFVHKLEMVGVCSGSCVYLGDGLFLTAKHVINDAPNNTVVKIDGVQYGGRRHWIGDHDIGYLQMQGIPADWPVAKVSLTDLMDAPTAVNLYGMSTGEHPAISDITKIFHDESVSLNLQDSSSVDHGDSGGGCFDEQGRLVGIISAKIRDTNNTISPFDDVNLPIAIITALSACHEDLPIDHLIPESQVAPPAPVEDGGGVTLLLFSASWCGPCKVVHQDVLPGVVASGIPVQERNYDTDHVDVSKYNITLLPTWIAVRNGTVIGRIVGSDHTVSDVLRLVTP